MEIEIKYTWKRKSDGHIYVTITPIECLEGKGDKPFLGNDEWELVSRDIFTGLFDVNKNKLYNNDKVAVYGWGINRRFDGVTKIIWDSDENGWNFKDTTYVEDRYDFAKAVKNCEKYED